MSHTFDNLNDWLIVYNVQNFLRSQRLDFCIHKAENLVGEIRYLQIDATKLLCDRSTKF